MKASELIQEIYKTMHIFGDAEVYYPEVEYFIEDENGVTDNIVEKVLFVPEKEGRIAYYKITFKEDELCRLRE